VLEVVAGVCTKGMTETGLPEPETPAAIIIDFISDWIEMLRGQLVHMGYQLGATEQKQRIVMKFFNVRRRRIVQRPRTVLTSKEFSCPPEHEDALREFNERTTRGEDLTPFQSKWLLDADYNDGLLSDWNIHHFHLSSLADADKPVFRKRTWQLLFAFVTDDSMLLIDVMPHGSWASQRLIEILHSNWPERLQRWRVAGVLGSERETSESDRLMLRKRVIDLTQVRDGTVYAPIGGGSASSGASVDAVEAADRATAVVRGWEEYVRSEAQAIVTAIRANGREPGNPPRFKLVVWGDSAFAVEQDSKSALLLE